MMSANQTDQALLLQVRTYIKNQNAEEILFSCLIRSVPYQRGTDLFVQAL